MVKCELKIVLDLEELVAIKRELETSKALPPTIKKLARVVTGFVKVSKRCH